jgi:hypothetical protein
MRASGKRFDLEARLAGGRLGVKASAAEGGQYQVFIGPFSNWGLTSLPDVVKIKFLRMIGEYPANVWD